MRWTIMKKNNYSHGTHFLVETYIRSIYPMFRCTSLPRHKVYRILLNRLKGKSLENISKISGYSHASCSNIIGKAEVYISAGNEKKNIYRSWPGIAAKNILPHYYPY